MVDSRTAMGEPPDSRQKPASGPLLLLPARLLFEEREWTRDELGGLAASWHARLVALPPPASGLLAIAFANHPHVVALFAALAAFPAPIVVLSPDPRAWRTDPPIPPGTRLVLAPEQGALAETGRAVGLEVLCLDHAPAPVAECAAPPAITPALVFFTSGSTGLPRPVYRSLERIVRAARVLAATLGLARGAGVLGTLPLARSYGLVNTFLVSALLDGRLALAGRFDPGRTLRLLASGDYVFWPSSPVMIDLAGRATPPLSAGGTGFTVAGPGMAAPGCFVAGRVTPAARRRMEERLGAPVGSIYGTTETGIVAIDLERGPERGAVTGQPLPGVQFATGEAPGVPGPPGSPGRVWISCPWLTAGYGFPPAIVWPGSTPDWLPTQDLGTLDATGSLRLSGRLDDCIRTGAGFLVNPFEVASALEEHPDVTEAVVVPLEASPGPVLGALVEGRPGLVSVELRRLADRCLPPWAQPRVVHVTAALPRLLDGRPDRLACIAALRQVADA